MEDKHYTILLVHNKYQQYGGEDSVVEAEKKLLEQQGHQVKLYSRDNTEINSMSSIDLLMSAVWSKKTVDDLKELINSNRPDILHIHNTQPLISPSVYWVANKFKIPVIQTIHNYRLACIQAMLLRNKQICKDCVGRIPWRGVIRRCYRNSLPASAVAAFSLQFHKAIGTYKKNVSLYIALTEFTKNELINTGIPANKIVVKPNFINLDKSKYIDNGELSNPLFVGRLSEEKGINLLAEMIQSFPAKTFDIVGSGPDEYRLKHLPNVNLIGQLDRDGVYKKIHTAPFIVMPSLCYENMPRTLVEAYALGTPVIASNIGPLADLVDNGKTGLHFESGSSADFVKTIKWALENTSKMKEMGNNAQKVYLENYSEQINYEQMISIYRRAIACSSLDHN